VSEVDFGYWHDKYMVPWRLTWNRNTKRVYARNLKGRYNVELGTAENELEARRILRVFVRRMRLIGFFPL